MTDAALIGPDAQHAWPSMVEDKPLRFAAVLLGLYASRSLQQNGEGK